MSPKRQMVVEQLMQRGIRDARVLEAFRQVPRERFVPPELASLAYADRALPIGQEQTISQPYIVARTLEALALTGSEVVLEVGTGSGYVTALLSHLAREVYSIERIRSLAEQAGERLHRLGFPARLACGDGTLGWPEHAPYDAIVVAASGPMVPPALLEQLGPRGRMVIPVSQDDSEWLLQLVRAESGAVSSHVLEEVRFVPLIGAQGVSEPAPRSAG